MKKKLVCELNGFKFLLDIIEKQLEYQNNCNIQKRTPLPISIKQAYTDGILSYSTVAKTMRQLLVCGYLSRPERGEYYVEKSTKDIVSSKRLEIRAKEIGKLMLLGATPITKDYNHRNIRE